MALVNILCSSWIPTLFLACVTLFLRERSGSWFAPSTFIGALWCLYLGLSQLLLDYRVSPLGIWILVALVTVIQLTAALGEMTSASARSSGGDENSSSIRSRVRSACWIFLAAALSGIIYFSISSLEIFDLPNTFESLVRIGGIWTLLRYDGNVDPWPLRLAAIWPYPTALLGGILSGIAQRRSDKYLSVVSLLPALLISILLGGREGFLIGLAAWLGGNWSATRASTREGRKLFDFKTLSALIFTAGFLLFLFVLVFAVRDAVNGDDLHLEMNGNQTRDYMFGPPLAFASWVDHGEPAIHAWGAFTFAGVFDLVGLRSRTIGTYTNFVNTIGSENTNIFTVFRGLIEDFTLAGATIVCGLFGYLSGKTYSKPSCHPWFILGLSAYYAVALFSPLFSFFSTNSPIFAWVMASMVLGSLYPSRTLLRRGALLETSG
jgi:oligosaccharide repeat unit polymerase